MKSQSTIHNKNPKSCQTEDNHLTKQAHYLLPTLEWESGLQRWRARTLSLDSRTGKTICLSTLFTEFNPFSVPWLSKIQHTVWLYQRSKNIWLQLEKFYLKSICGQCHDWRQWISSFCSVPAATQVWMTQNQHYPDVRFPLHSFPGTFIRMQNSTFHINTNMSTTFELFS